MKQGLRGQSLPENEKDFQTLSALANARYLVCVFCKKPFSGENVTTRAGWLETQISGSCEKCFDDLFEPEAV